MKKTFTIILALVMLTSTLAACSSGEGTAQKAEINSSYLISYVDEDGMSCVDSVKTLSDGTYEKTHTQVAAHEGDIMATYVIITNGTYEKGTETDGFTELKLSEADLIRYDSMVYHGMFHITIDSRTSTFPAELVGGEMIEESAFKTQYGSASTYYIVGEADGSETNELLTELP